MYQSAEFRRLAKEQAVENMHQNFKEIYEDESEWFESGNPGILFTLSTTNSNRPT
jgi:hypothetical protein